MSTTWKNNEADSGQMDLLELAMKANHSQGLPWTHPQTGQTHLPPASQVAKAPQAPKKARKPKAKVRRVARPVRKARR